MEKIKSMPIWVAWKYEIVNDKKTKVPYQINGKKASTSDPKTWAKFSDVSSHKNFDGVGIVFESSARVVGIDFDSCVLSGSFPSFLLDFFQKANTYIESSPSKTGCHVLFVLSEDVELAAHKHYFDDPSLPSSHVEVYTKGRYFTFTQDELPQSKPIRTVSKQEFLDVLALLGYPWEKKTSLKKMPEAPSFFVSQTHFSDDDILQKMFASKNGAQIKKLYDGDASKYDDDISSADFALCIHLAFWTRKDIAQMESIWLQSPLGKREKTQNRKDYRDRTIANACDVVLEVRSLPLHFAAESGDIDFEFFTEKNKNGSVTVPCIFPNICRVLRKHPFFQNKFRRNDFSQMHESSLLANGKKWMALNDEAIASAREFIAETFSPFRKVSLQMVTESVLAVAQDERINPPKDFLTSLSWDKVPRLNSWLHHAYGTPDDELHQAIGANWLKGLVKRVMFPGCQFDEVLALESPQGWRKSTSIRVLGAPWHVETTHSVDHKDFFLTLAQNVIVEFSEGEIFDRASVNKLKAEITKTEDQFRPPYERGIVKFPRSCVFAVTTNKLELKDDTGNRRWLPVSLEHPADIEWLKENKDQLFAEAFYRVINLRESTHEYPKEPLDELQSSRGEWSGYDEKVLFWYASLFPIDREKNGVSLHAAVEAAYGAIKITKIEELQVSSILRRTLFLESRNKKINGAVLKRWFPSEKTRKIIAQIEKEKPTLKSEIPFL